MVLADAPGLLCSIWMTFSLYPHASPKVSAPTLISLNMTLVEAEVIACISQKPPGNLARASFLHALVLALALALLPANLSP